MRKGMLTLVGLLALGLFGGTGRVEAQNMDMSWGIQQQMYCQQWTNQYAQNAANAYLQWARQYRAATGYTGPIQIPFNAMTISNSLNQGQQSFYNYMNSCYANSASRAASAERYSNEAILGQSPYYNPYTGQTYMMPNYYNYQYGNAGGYTYGSNSAWGQQGYTQMQYNPYYYYGR